MLPGPYYSIVLTLAWRSNSLGQGGARAPSPLALREIASHHDQAHAGRRIEIVRVLSSINPVYGQLILGVTPLCASVVRLPFGKFTPRREE